MDICTECRALCVAVDRSGLCVGCALREDRDPTAELRGPHGIVRREGRAPERDIGRLHGEPSNALDVVAYMRRYGIEV